MSKKNNPETPQEEAVQQEQATVSGPMKELMENGGITLTAKTREELQESAVALIEQSEGKAYAAGGAAFDADKGVHFQVVKLKEK